MRAPRQSSQNPPPDISQPADHPGRLRALAASARVANIPSVLSNVSLGVVLGMLAATLPMEPGFWRAPAAAALSAVLLYLAGNFINDWADRDWDAKQRPERALPRKLFAPGIYLVVAAGFLLSGLAAAACAGRAPFACALAIAICILLYTWLHKRTAWSVIPLAQCRALLPLLGFVAIASHGGFPFVMAARGAGLALFCHIIGLSLFARHETSAIPLLASRHPASAWFALGALASFSSAHFFLHLPLLHCLVGLVPYILWTANSLVRFRQPASSQVSKLLAGIPLVDWMLLLPLFLSSQSLAMSQGTSIACLCLPPLTVIAGKALQRYASAT